MRIMYLAKCVLCIYQNVYYVFSKRYIMYLAKGALVKA